LGDFDLSEIYNKNNENKFGGVKGSMYYLAPELFSGFIEYIPENDIWSAGVVFAELLTKNIGFFKNDFTDILHFFKDKCSYFNDRSIDCNIDDVSKALLFDILNPISNRIDLDHILNHKYFEN
jgi:serine/threonine protein kinase